MEMADTTLTKEDNMYHGYEESQDRITDRMNRTRLADVVATYGEGWEQTADLIRPLIAAAEAGEGFSDVWCYENELVDTGLNDDRPYKPATGFMEW